MFPGRPPKGAQTIAEHMARRGNGRVGCAAAGHWLKEEALTLAVVAHIRPRFCNYDELLKSGYDRSGARA